MMLGRYGVSYIIELLYSFLILFKEVFEWSLVLKFMQMVEIG